MELIKDNTIVGVQGQIDTTPANNHLYYYTDTHVNKFLRSEMTEYPATSGNALIKSNVVYERSTRFAGIGNWGYYYATSVTTNGAVSPITMWSSANSHVLMGQFIFYENKSKYVFYGTARIGFIEYMSDVDTSGVQINTSPGSVSWNIASLGLFKTPTTVNARCWQYRFGYGDRAGRGGGFWACGISVSGTTVTLIPNVAGDTLKYGQINCWSDAVPIQIWGNCQ